MALTRKGSRRIVVGERTYRWVVRRKPTYLQAVFCTALAFAVELEDVGQSTLVVELNAPRPDNSLEKPGHSIAPSQVVKAITKALGGGWLPEKKRCAI